MRNYWLATVLALAALMCAIPSIAAGPAPEPSYVIRASTANPATGTVRWDRAEAIVCQVAVDANTHAVTVQVRFVLPDGTALPWVEWPTAAGDATDLAPWFFVIPYNLFELRISVANAGGDVVTAGCMPWGGVR